MVAVWQDLDTDDPLAAMNVLELFTTVRTRIRPGAHNNVANRISARVNFSSNDRLIPSTVMCDRLWREAAVFVSKKRSVRISVISAKTAPCAQMADNPATNGFLRDSDSLRNVADIVRRADDETARVVAASVFRFWSHLADIQVCFCSFVRAQRWLVLVRGAAHSESVRVLGFGLGSWRDGPLRPLMDVLQRIRLARVRHLSWRCCGCLKYR